jgi:hypothetical protein
LFDNANTAATSFLALALIMFVLGSEDEIVDCMDVNDLEAIARLSCFNPQPVVFDDASSSSSQSRQHRRRLPVSCSRKRLRLVLTIGKGFGVADLNGLFEKVWEMLEWPDELRLHRDSPAIIAASVLARLSFHANALGKLSSSRKVIAQICDTVCEDTSALLRLQDELCLPYRRRIARMTHLFMILENAIQVGLSTLKCLFEGEF